MKKNLISFIAIFSILPTLVFAQTQGDVNPNITLDCPSITHNLQYRSRDISTGGDVSTLQDFLQSRGYLNSEPTGYFGLLTKAAVKSFQSASGILNSGYVGRITREKISTDCGDVLPATSTPSRPISTTSKGDRYSKLSIVSLGTDNALSGEKVSIYVSNFPIGYSYSVTFQGSNNSGNVNGILSSDGSYLGFTVPNLNPGIYTLTAEVRNINGSLIATTKNSLPFTISNRSTVQNNQNQSKPSLNVMNLNGGDLFKSTDKLFIAINNPVYNTTYNAFLMYGEKTVSQLGQVKINYQTDVYKTSFDIPQLSAYLGSGYNIVLYPYSFGDNLTSNYFSIISLTTVSTENQPSKTQTTTTVNVISPNGGSYPLGSPMQISWDGGPFDTILVRLTGFNANTILGDIGYVSGNNNSLNWDGKTICQSSYLNNPIGSGCSTANSGTHRINLVGTTRNGNTIYVESENFNLTGSASVAKIDGPVSEWGTTNTNVGTSISVLGQFSTGQHGDAKTVIWNFGDGKTQVLDQSPNAATGGVIGKHTYTSAGTYTVTLTFTTTDGTTITSNPIYVKVN